MLYEYRPWFVRVWRRVRRFVRNIFVNGIRTAVMVEYYYPIPRRSWFFADGKDMDAYYKFWRETHPYDFREWWMKYVLRKPFHVCTDQEVMSAHLTQCFGPAVLEDQKREWGLV